MKRFPIPTPLKTHPLDEILRFVHQLRAKASSPSDNLVVIDLPEELAPIDPKAGAELMRDRCTAVAMAAAEVRDTIVMVCQTAIRVELSEALVGGAPRPIPELSDRLRSVGGRIRTQLVGMRGIGRMLNCFEDLPHFFQILDAYRTAPARLSPECQKLLGAEGITHPEFLRRICPEGVVEWLGAFHQILKAQLNPSAGAGDAQDAVTIPVDFQPIPYGEGMPMIWAMTNELTEAVNALDGGLGLLCQGVVRGHLSESNRTGTVTPHPDLAKCTVQLGVGATTLLEDLVRQADQLAEYRTAYDLSFPEADGA